jgi:hypothetical protein
MTAFAYINLQAQLIAKIKFSGNFFFILFLKKKSLNLSPAGTVML